MVGMFTTCRRCFRGRTVFAQATVSEGRASMGDVNIVCGRGCPTAYGVRAVAGFGEGRLLMGGVVFRFERDG